MPVGSGVVFLKSGGAAMAATATGGVELASTAPHVVPLPEYPHPHKELHIVPINDPLDVAAHTHLATATIVPVQPHPPHQELSFPLAAYESAAVFVGVAALLALRGPAACVMTKWDGLRARVAARRRASRRARSRGDGAELAGSPATSGISPDPVARVGRALEEREVVADPDQWPPVARQHDDREGSKDGVDGTALEPELAEIRAREQRLGALEQLRRARARAHASSRVP
jgi:hypothetical protein